MSNAKLADQYTSLTGGSGFVELNDRCLVRLTGADRQAFFHNFCTNEIKQLNPNSISEAFVLNTKGKLLGHVHAIAGETELLLSGHGDQATKLVNHLDMYLIREDVELLDVTSDFASIFVCGGQAAQALATICNQLPAENESTEASVGGHSVQVCQIEIAGFGFLLIVEKSKLNAVKKSLLDAGIVECSLPALEVVRVENRTPWFGIDADDSNLPQELQRDEIAISFDKGCYLGQETVARIDARGRVNQLLVGFKLKDESPVIGEVMHEGKVAGRISSIVFSPKNDAYIGLGYIRRQFKEPGTEVGEIVVL